MARNQNLIADLRKLASFAKERFRLDDVPLKDIHIVDLETLYECLQRAPLSEEAQVLLKTLTLGFVAAALEQNTLDQPATPSPHVIQNIEALQRNERKGKLIAAPAGRTNEMRLIDFVWLGEATGHVEPDEYLRTNIVLLILAMLDGAFIEFAKSEGEGTG
jgi:hypothetical protein